MRKLQLHWQIIIGLVLGIVYSYLSVRFDWNEFTLDYIMPFGDIFISLLKMIAVPLVLFSIIVGVASLKDIRKLGKMGIKTLLLYVLTTAIAVCVGLVVVNLLKPGTRAAEDLRVENRISYEMWRTEAGAKKLDDICLSCDPANEAIVERVRQKQKSEGSNEWVSDKLAKAEQTRREGPLQPLVDVIPENIFISLSTSSMLQVIFFAILFGLMLVALPEEKQQPVYALVDGLNEIFIKMVWVVMKAMPFFVFALMAGQVVKAAGTDPDKFLELLGFLLNYGVVLIIGLAFMAFVFYPLMVQTLVKDIRYKGFLAAMRDAQITAFSTSSSVATLPITMQCVHEKLGVSERTTSFVLPIGATINMDGTSLYQAVAVVALAQFHMVDLTLGQQLVIIITASLASIGAAAIPSAGLVLMIIVLESVGLNPAWIALIFPIDRILDMCRTVVNVTGDGAVSAIIASSEGEMEYVRENT
ncbi:MAG: dicarboxylate/amino acid:cation symporter [Cryomorphaceae bacterium]|nr:MAG: dicarboxylate/amino acid:cation symporter [Cryomorphaceae bacterium]